MYIKTLNPKKENACPSVDIHSCNFCKEEMNGGDPMFSAGNIDICEDCVLKMAEGVIKLNMGGWKLFWLEEVRMRYFQKKKRSCYLNKKTKEEILTKYKFTCQNCGTKENLTIDHIKPVSLGGTNESRNLTVLCKSCNSRKGAKYGK